jgi:hypothetical protein
MAAVTAADEFFDDPDFDHLGVILGIDGDLVRMKMMRLWRWQTEHFTGDAPTYVVTRGNLVARFGIRGPEAMIEAGLADERPDGFYIRGSQGRIEWLWLKRKAGKKGGDKRAEVAAAGDRASDGRFGSGGQPSTSQAPAKQVPSTSQAATTLVTSIRDQGSGIRDNPEDPTDTQRAEPLTLEASRPRKRRSPRTRIETPIPDDFAPDDKHRALAVELGLDVSHQHALFRAHHESVGSLFKLWPSAFTKWLHIAHERASRGGGYGGNRGPVGIAATREILTERKLIDPFAITREKP